VRHASTDDEAWEVRLTALATLGQFDALTFVLIDDAAARHAHNLTEDPTEEPAIRDAIGEAVRAGAAAQLRVAVPLADGRMATAVLVSPLAASDTSAGALVALRVGRPFAALDARNAVAIAELASLELARTAGAVRETSERRQALALYELARLALFADDVDGALHGIAILLSGVPEHEAAHVWIRGDDGALHRRAAHPSGDETPRPLWPDDHEALWGALRERRIVRVTRAAAVEWLPQRTSEALVVPLRGDERPLGVLILARAGSPYALDDIEMADVLGTFVGRVVATARRAAAPTYHVPAPPHRDDLVGEQELAESPQPRS
jgi:hypothetical protein